MVHETSPTKVPRSWWAGLLVISILFALVLLYTMREKKPKMASPEPSLSGQAMQKSATAAVYVPDPGMRHEGEFSLPVGAITQTVWAAAGTHHRLTSNKPFVAISIEPDGSKMRWPMPAGKSVWNGANPGGSLLLEGLEEGTIVGVKKVR